MNIVNLKTYRVLKEREQKQRSYFYALLKMDKAALLQELLNYHESYQRDPHDIDVTIRGQMLMQVLEQRAELTDLQDLSREFQDKLKTRLNQQIRQLPG